MTTYIIAHKACYDGFGAAWVCKQELERTTSAKVDSRVHPLEIHFCAYGDPLPSIDDGSYVYMVDFSFPRDVLVELATRVKLTVLDHHKTAQANCEGLSFCTFDMERSGAGLAWDHFNPNTRRAELVNYIEDRDLWRFALVNSKAIHAYIESFPKDYDTWNLLNAALEEDRFLGTAHTASFGASILRFANQKVEETCEQVRFTRVAEFDNIPTVNCPYSMGSDACHRLLELYPGAPFAAYYLDRGDGEQQWGLRGRSTDDFDVSEVAKSLGGGGHKKASGFVKGKVTR